MSFSVLVIWKLFFKNYTNGQQLQFVTMKLSWIALRLGKSRRSTRSFKALIYQLALKQISHRYLQMSNFHFSHGPLDVVFVVVSEKRVIYHICRSVSCIDYIIGHGLCDMSCSVLIISYTLPPCETTKCLRSTNPTLGIRQFFHNVTKGQWRHIYPN